MLRKAARISRWVCVYPGIALILLTFISDILTKEPLNVVNSLELSVLLLVLHAVHVGSLYVLGMLWKHAEQKGKIKDLNSGRFVQRTTWDEVRGFREYLKKVERPRVAISIANNDRTYLTSSKVAFMISLGLLSSKQIKAVLQATSRSV